jgi:hypothetical protein
MADEPTTLGPHGGRRVKGERGDNVTLRTRGNSKAYVVARLERDGFDDLVREVEAGRLSAWAAGRRAGWLRWEVRRREQDRPREQDARKQTEQERDVRLASVAAMVG